MSIKIDLTYNEKKPWGKHGHPIQGDNIEKSRERYAAQKAMRAGTATPEQVALVQECDLLIRQAIERRDGQE